MSRRQQQSGSKKRKREITEGIAHVIASFNSTMVVITETNGNVIYQSSGGRMGFKGSRKGTPHAAQLAASDAAQHVMNNCKMKRLITVKLRGPGAGGDYAIRALRDSGLQIRRLENVTPVPHNGCRPKKKRRV